MNTTFVTKKYFQKINFMYIINKNENRFKFVNKNT